MAKKPEQNITNKVADDLASTGQSLDFLIIIWIIAAPLILIYLIFKYSIRGIIKLVRKIKRK